MANFNRVILAGNLTRDPQLSHTPNNTAVCEFGMAINRKYKGGDGQQHEDVCFVDCQAWGKTGEIINQYMIKGKPLLVEGRLTFDQWQDKQGQKRSRLRVTVENFQFLGGQDDQQAPRAGGRQESPEMGGRQPQPGDYGPSNNQRPQGPPPSDTAPSGEDDPNIPF